jgi:hypothetical protein
MPSTNGESDGAKPPLELNELLHIQTKGGTEILFEVVGIVEDPDDGTTYAVLRRDAGEGDDEFIVTDLDGNLLKDAQLAQEILDEFLRVAEDGE